MIKQKNLLLSLVLFFISNILYADEQPTWSIVHLAELADTVIEAKIIGIEDEHYTMVIKDLEREMFSDTIVIKVSESYYFTDAIKTSERLIIYCNLFSSGVKKDTLSGGTFRILKDGNILLPWQMDNPGKVAFVGSSEDSLPWSDFKKRIISVNKRIKKIHSYNKIKDRSQKNKLLINFIEENQNSFNLDCHANADCGWGFLEGKVFRWITQSNIAEDTWKAAALYRKIFTRYSNRLIYDEKGSSFRSAKDQEFLISKASSETVPLIERKQALFFLKTAKPSLKNIRNKILPLLSDHRLRQLAIEVINEPTHNEEEISLAIQPTLVAEYNNASPGEYKNEIGKYLGRTCTNEVWKKISGSDENLALYLYSIRVSNRTSRILSFNMYHDINRGYDHAIYDIQPFPTIIIEDATTSKEVFRKILEDQKLGSWAVNIRMDIDSLPTGEYHFYLLGEAGKKSEYKWKSINGKFIIE